MKKWSLKCAKLFTYLVTLRRYLKVEKSYIYLVVINTGLRQNSKFEHGKIYKEILSQNVSPFQGIVLGTLLRGLTQCESILWLRDQKHPHGKYAELGGLSVLPCLYSSLYDFLFLFLSCCIITICLSAELFTYSHNLVWCIL